MAKPDVLDVPKGGTLNGSYYIRLRFLQDSSNVQFSLFLPGKDTEVLNCKANFQEYKGYV